ncbi:E3 ubiquitin-protein ligase TRIM33-like [Glandiceps talaboti]
MASYQQVQTIAAIDDNFLLCGICCELYKVPKILPCLHIFCEGCLTQLADKNGGHTFSCPLCRRSYALPQDDVSNFRTDIFLSGLVNDKQGDAVSKTKKCDACKTGDVVKVCTDCPMAICEICVRVHRNIPLTHAHNLMTPEDYESSKVNDPASVQQPVYCDSHPNIELKMYCVTCQKAICSECGMVAHYEHKHRYLKDSADDYVKELSGMVEKLKTKCQETKISMTKIQETSEKLESNYKNENQKVKEHVEEITQQVKVAGQRLQEEVKHIYNRQKTNLNAQFKELEGLDSDIHAVEEYATNFMQRGSPAQLMSSKTAMTTQIQHLLKTNTNPTPIESGYLQFKPSSNIIDAQTMGKVTDKRSVYVLEGIPQPARTNEIVQATLRPKFQLESRIVASHVKAVLTTPTGVEDVKMIEANGYRYLIYKGNT